MSKTSILTPLSPEESGYAIYKRLAIYAVKHWKYLIVAIVGLIIGGLTIPLFAVYMQPLLDGTFMDKDPEIIEWAPFALLLIFLLRGISGFMSSYSMEWIGRSVVKEIRSELFSRLLRLPVSFYDKNNSGQLVTRLIYHVEQVSIAATKGLTTLVQDTVVVIGSIGVMLYYSWKLTLIIFFVGPIIAALIAYISKRFRRLSGQIQEQVSEVTQIGHEVINANREIRIYDGQEYESKRFETVNERNHRSYMKRIVTEKTSMPIVQFIMAIALAVVLYTATHGDLLESFTPGRFMAFLSAMIALFDPVKRLTQVNAILQGGIAAGESIFSLLDETTEKDSGTLDVEKTEGNFEFSHVNFSYNEGSEQVLKDITFSVNPGDKIALVGQSGSGKTTLVNLLPRFYDLPEEEQGKITLDGHALSDFKLRNLRSQFAYVGQDVTMFNDTIRNNIAYGHMRTASDEQIRAAAEAAFALEFIEKLPLGFDTEVGENGTLLSGGQKQRVAIARAILSDAPILILDEATSALDTKSERHIQAALETLLENRTTFMIAHRLSTIEKADKIMMMESGRIIETGTHDELLAKKGAYANLHQLQFLK
ncbi:lipid A ABC transporter ATP-binding protein/permease MsbA [Cocleimonas flava]|uniref:Subfamily B ATP-binding cassette protein MsbA n=1 Tax=Cocleimonas flava TaxID=634765 RepID=A0A4R1EZG7_9GAMM|nr:MULTISPECIES: lipid A export permease/ATP-binding protein MsbA [Cocleimonas]MEB8431849.1 lipid A export permease/ATP-binding protein MsbA [Cocleimonas sp. KMM 6892]MEC4715065.1 lipid A export permease/ATP-binding protein MsbA [Cocleimonas sp. KMM 6895]MEC4744121.1 lipid A export permease/ATP-binding protein MsbA [Cocleimonas sp. KMM 6896]TCJ87287.1 subfamily B ATP-binding cassette protein MsbA [Cocleimonas flava]